MKKYMKKQALILRAPNWIGDTIYCIPVWGRLSEQYHLHIIGKGWLKDLLSGYPEWQTYKLPAKVFERRAQYLKIKNKLQAENQLPNGINAIVFPTSFGSVFEPFLAGLHVLAHAHEGRSLLLKQKVTMPSKASSIYKRYWDLGDAFFHGTQSVPKSIHFKINPEVEHLIAHTYLKEHGLSQGEYIVLCPFAAGNFEGQDKKWPEFGSFANQLMQMGWPVVCCPAPNEEETWQSQYSNIPALKNLSLSEYAAVLKYAKCVVANDTGPGHLAAGVGVKTISVLNRTKFETYGAVGDHVSYVKHEPNWPSVEAVMQHVQLRLNGD